VLLPSAVGLAFEGQVLLPDGSPARDATIAVIGQTGSSRADGEGRFRWQPDPPVPFQVLVVLESGRAAPPVWIEVLPESGPVIVRIEPSIAESVTVTAGAAPNISAPPASARDRIAREDFVQRGSQRVADLIENLPGTGRLEEGQSSVPSLRGLARGRTLLLVDGARVTAERRAGPSATFLDPLSLESVEVARGPGSVAYGSDAFGGVIDARTRTAAHGAPLGVRFEGTLAAGLPEAGAAVEVTKGFTHGGLLIGAHARDLDDYHSPEGEVIDSRAADQGFLIRGSQEAANGLLGFGWRSDSGQEIGKPNIDSASTHVFYPRETSNRLNLAYDFDPGAGFTEAAISAFLGTYRLVLDRDIVASATTPRTLASSDTEARDFGLRAAAARVAGQGLVRFGVDLNGRLDLHAVNSTETFDASGGLTSKSEATSVDDADRRDAGLYVIGEVPFGRVVTGSAGLRGDHVETHNHGGFYGDRSTSEAAWAGHAAVSFRIPKGFGATLQAARGFRDPTLSDRYYVGASGRGFVTGNPDLEPETSYQVDLALTWTGERLGAAVYAYQYRIDDLIERYEQGSGQFYFRNRGRARLRGVELELRGETRGGFSYALAVQGASGRVLDDDSPLDDSPPFNGNIVLRQRLRDRGYLLLRAAAFAQDDQPGPTEITTPGYSVLDLGGGWNLNHRLELRLLLRNVTDKAYPATADAKAVLAPGQSGQVTIAVSF